MEPLKRFAALSTCRAMTVDHAYSIAYDRLRQLGLAVYDNAIEDGQQVYFLLEEVADQLENHLCELMYHDRALAKLLSRPQTEI